MKVEDPSGVRLTVCIPVFNFGDVLGETLDSILPQAGAGVEVLVVDGASTDDTGSVIAARTSAWPQLRYVRLEQRGGIDGDLATAVSIARGEYCWLFSGDDIMRPGALGRALERLQANHDVYICRHTVCDREMRFLREYPVFQEERERVVQLGVQAEREQWMAAALNTEALFSFMSGLIVRRAKWLSADPPAQFVGSCWAHVARLLALAPAGLSVCYVAETWLDRRGDNDSFRDRGVVNRFRIAVDGYLAIAGYYFGQVSPEIEHVRRFLRTELSLASFFFARERVLENRNEDRGELDRLFRVCYAGMGFRGRLYGMFYSTFPVAAYRALRAAYRVWLASRRRLPGRMKASKGG